MVHTVLFISISGVGTVVSTVHYIFFLWKRWSILSCVYLYCGNGGPFCPVYSLLCRGNGGSYCPVYSSLMCGNGGLNCHVYSDFVLGNWCILSLCIVFFVMGTGEPFFPVYSYPVQDISLSWEQWSILSFCISLMWERWSILSCIKLCLTWEWWSILSYI